MSGHYTGFKPVPRWIIPTCWISLLSIGVLLIGLSVTTVFNQQERVKMGEVAKAASMQSTLDSMTLRLDAKDLKIEQLLDAQRGVRIALETCLEGR